MRHAFGGHLEKQNALAPEKQENPLLEGLGIARTPESCAVVIFGASGDLTHKLFPALYSLAFRHLLPRNFAVLGVARTEGSDEEFREDMKSAVQEHGRDPFREDIWETLAEGMRYLDMDFRDDASWNKVTKALADLDKNMGTGGNRVYYFAVPPAGTLVEEIGKRRSKNGWNRLVIEKPFGNDLSSARELNGPSPRSSTSPRSSIDHYLGKETVQNMLALRFANGIFEPVWNRQFIDHVQITVAESIGIENRAGYYESAGVIRDVFQNHLLQLVALTAMEPPIDFSAEAVRNEKVKVLRPCTRRDRSTSSAASTGAAGSTEEVPAYREEERRARFDHRHVHRRQALRGQLALGGHAVLRARGEAARATGDDDRDSVPARAAPAVRGDRG